MIIPHNYSVTEIQIEIPAKQKKVILLDNYLLFF
jgi:hypothetical protein